jgi:hypothetical protein
VIKFVLAFLFAGSLGATPNYSEDFSAYPNGQVITFTAGANYSASHAATGAGITATHFGEQSAKLTATGNWSHWLFKGLTMTSQAVSITVRCDGSAARCNFGWFNTGLAGGLPTQGYQLQSIPSLSQFKLFKNGYGTEILTAGSVAPANSADYTIGVYVSSTGTATIFMDGVAKGAVNDTTYGPGAGKFFVLGTFGGDAYVTDIYVDDTTPTPTATPLTTRRSPWLRNRLRLILGSKHGGSERLYASGGSKVGDFYDHSTHLVK